MATPYIMPLVSQRGSTPVRSHGPDLAKPGLRNILHDRVE